MSMCQHLPSSPGRQPELAGVVFDLDGVLVSTEHLHYAAWKQMAEEEHLPFGPHLSGKLRGVSRPVSLRIIFDSAGLPPPDDALSARLCDRKNELYLQLIRNLGPSDLFPGVRELLLELRRRKVLCAVASASRNCLIVLERTGLLPLLDAVIDGNSFARSKPDPQCFQLALERLRLDPNRCVGVEDAAVGIEAIHRAGMAALGIGPDAEGADVRVGSLAEVSPEMLHDVLRRFGPVYAKTPQAGVPQ